MQDNVEVINISSDDEDIEFRVTAAPDVGMESDDELAAFFKSFEGMDDIFDPDGGEKNAASSREDAPSTTELELASWDVMEQRVLANVLQGRDVRRTDKFQAVFSIQGLTVFDKEFAILNSHDWYNDKVSLLFSS